MPSHANLKDAEGAIDTLSLHLEWAEAPWDTAVFGFPVLQISHIAVNDKSAASDFGTFEAARDRLGAGLVSCRMPHERLNESMLLEDHGFRFIEMVYMPELDSLASVEMPEKTDINVGLAGEGDLHALMEIAGSAFHNERFHVDPRLDPALGDERYRRWVQNSLGHPHQRLYVIRDGAQPVAFFLTEVLADGTCYWHLNAVSPQVQGRGYGRRAWQAMLREAKAAGAQRVRTCIVARNFRVLNLYARLGFRFPAPLMTFHWVRDMQP
jgi:RimJ/RimL family protein N-acetyltransferase